VGINNKISIGSMLLFGPMEGILQWGSYLEFHLPSCWK